MRHDDPITTRSLTRRASVLQALLALAAASASACGMPRPVPPAAATPGGVGFSGTLDRTAVLLGSDGIVRTELVVRAPDGPPGAPRRVPTDLVVVLDRSGSMGGAKIEDAKSAVRELISMLGPQDRFALVTYASDARVDVPLTPDCGLGARGHPHFRGPLPFPWVDPG